MLKDWLRLSCVKSLTVAQKQELAGVFGGPGALFAAAEQSLAAIPWLGRPAVRELLDPGPAVTAAVQTDLELMEQLGAIYLGFSDPEFPWLLKQIRGAPLGLFVLGDPALLARPQVAMVGSRSTSPAGLATARDFARAFAMAGLVVTSGLASGADSAAHDGCIRAGRPTIAVMGTGIDLSLIHI